MKDGEMMASGSNTAKEDAAEPGPSGRVNHTFGVIDTVAEGKTSIDISGLPVGQTQEETLRRNYENWPVNDRARDCEGMDKKL